MAVLLHYIFGNETGNDVYLSSLPVDFSFPCLPFRQEGTVSWLVAAWQRYC
jgi:hypothetical protein